VIFRYFIDRAIKRFRAAREAETAEEAARPADTLIACTETLDKLTV
jgi:ornithine cyclodeaminase/alanine dehydrogenase-like protein (mu-crystallin family)